MLLKFNFACLYSIEKFSHSFYVSRSRIFFPVITSTIVVVIFRAGKCRRSQRGGVDDDDERRCYNFILAVKRSILEAIKIIKQEAVWKICETIIDSDRWMNKETRENEIWELERAQHHVQWKSPSHIPASTKQPFTMNLAHARVNFVVHKFTLRWIHCWDIKTAWVAKSRVLTKKLSACTRNSKTKFKNFNLLADEELMENMSKIKWKSVQVL